MQSVTPRIGITGVRVLQDPSGALAPLLRDDTVMWIP